MKGQFALGVKIALLIRSNSIREQLGDPRKEITRDPGARGLLEQANWGLLQGRLSSERQQPGAGGRVSQAGG